MDYMGETFLFPVIGGQSLAAPASTFQYFYPCDGGQVPVVDGDEFGHGDLRPLASLLGTDLTVPDPVITLPDLPSPAAGVQWFITNAGPWPTGEESSSEFMAILGEITLFPTIAGRTYDPSEVLPCDGRLYPSAENADLFGLLGTTFGGDGVNAFGMPNIPSPLPSLFFGMCATGTTLPLVAFPQEVPG